MQDILSEWIPKLLVVLLLLFHLVFLADALGVLGEEHLIDFGYVGIVALMTFAITCLAFGTWKSC